MLEILNQIKPSNEERKKFNEIVREFISKIKIKDAKVELGGSGIKDTWLKGNYDIDIYVKFPLDYEKDISKVLGRELRKRFSKVEILHGSRDYFQIKYKDYDFEIIPILEINKAKQAKNITDISPLHAKYVKKFKKRDEIRLSKAFCRAQNCYGAESYIKGFSGYCLEVLTIYYRSFNNLIKNVAKWKDKTFIGNKKDIKNLNNSKKESPLILIDPVDANRNVAAALSKEKYDDFIKACKKYLKKPSNKFFIKDKFSMDKIKIKGDLIILEIEPIKSKIDVQGAKMLKALNYINKELKRNDFKVYKFGWDFNTRVFYFDVDKKKLNEKIKHYGPSVKYKDRLNAFKKKWKNIKIEKERSYVLVKRKYREARKFIENLIKNDGNIKRLVKEIKSFK